MHGGHEHSHSPSHAHGSGHGHSHGRGAHERQLWIALALTLTVLVVELVAAFITHSLALFSDAAHMFTDGAALGISLIALRIARRAADRKRTFGYHRFEILAAALNAALLLIVALYILYEAYERLRTPQPIESLGMLAVATLGLIVNLISMRVLQAGSAESVNMKGAYLEVWSDMLGSLGVILAALVVHFTGYLWVDAMVAAAIGLWVLPRTWRLLKQTTNVLLQGVPEGIDVQAIETALLEIDGVLQVHDLHVWSLTSGKNVLSVHLVADVSSISEQELLSAVDRAIGRFHISHTTTQIEGGAFPCGSASL